MGASMLQSIASGDPRSNPVPRLDRFCKKHSTVSESIFMGVMITDLRMSHKNKLRLDVFCVFLSNAVGQR